MTATKRIPGNKLTIEDCRESASKMGGKCLSTEYVDIFHKMTWMCSEGHIWEARYTQIRNKNHWCIECTGRKIIDINMCKAFAEDKAGSCLSTVYTNARSNMIWQCECWYIWETTADKILNRGDWCPKCRYIRMSEKMILKNGLEIAQEVAANNGGKCLSKKYTKGTVKISWQCNKGHVFDMRLGNAQRGQWCPLCQRGKNQNKLAKIIENITKCEVLQNYKGFVWLRNKKTKGIQEIDIWVPQLKLAIEYDGQQHFYPVTFGGMSKEEAKIRFKRAQQNDKRKNRLMKKNVNDIFCFVRFNYKEKITKEYVISKLIKSGLREEVLV